MTDFATQIINENHHPDSPLGFIAECLQDGRLEVRTDVPNVEFVRTAHVFRMYLAAYAATHEPSDPYQRFPAVAPFGKRAFTQEARTRFPVVHSNGHRFQGLHPGPAWVPLPPARLHSDEDVFIPSLIPVPRSPALEAFKRAGMQPFPPHLDPAFDPPPEQPEQPEQPEPPAESESSNVIDWSLINAAPESAPESPESAESAPESELTPPPDSGIMENTDTPAPTDTDDTQGADGQ